MESSTQVAAITPALTKDVSFGDQVTQVETAFKSRSAAQRDIKTAWANVVQVLAKYNVKAPHRRASAADAAALVENITVLQPKSEIDEGLKAILEADGGYYLSSIAERPNLARLVNTKVKGLRKFLDDLMEARALMRQPSEVDKEATDAARAEYRKVVDAYIEAVEAYDATFDSVANVKEYIGIVKDIADISAIAQGVKPKE